MSSLVFLRHWLRSPFTVGSLVPSSAALSREMAKGAGLFEHVVELGAGTGPVTSALAAQVKAGQLTVLEPSAQLCRRLAATYPGARVLPCFAHEVPELFAALPDRTLLVSAIPFRSLPKALSDQTVEMLLGILREQPGRLLVQFTYQPRPPFAVPDEYLWHFRKVVWQNMPPAGVWELRWRRGN